MAAANAVREQAMNRQSMLEQWAMQQSQGLEQLKTNLAGVYQTNYNMPAFQGMNSTPREAPASSRAYFAGRSSDTDERDYFA